MGVQSIKALLLVTFLFCYTLVQAAFDLSTQHNPQGPLKLRLDFPWANKANGPGLKDHHWMVSSHLTFKNPVSEISDGQLIQLALDAYAEILPEIQQYVTGRRLPAAVPGAMNALAFGNEIIFVSSFKGGSDFVTEFPDSEVSKMLEQCIVTFQRTQYQAEELDDHQPNVGTGHRTKGHCGEITGFHLYSRRYPGLPLNLRSDNPRSTTVNLRRGRLAPADACSLGPGEREKGFMHGCDWIVRLQGVDYLAEGAGEPYELDGDNALAGGLDGPIGQLLICS